MKVIAVRGPKDTVVSLFHHVVEAGFGPSGNFDDFLRCFQRGNAENGSWFAPPPGIENQENQIGYCG